MPRLRPAAFPHNAKAVAVDSTTNATWATAWRDLGDGFRRRDIWSMLAWNDIRSQYRRSMIGPFWFTISMAISVAAIGTIYATLLGQSLDEYFPRLAGGLIIWAFLSTIFNEACFLFIAAEGLLKQQRLPPTLFIWRALLKNLIILAHYLPVFVVVGIIFGATLSWWTLLLAVSLPLVCVSLAPPMLLCGMLCTRFRDLQPIVANAIQVFFFITPVLWQPQGAGTVTARVAMWNPLAHVLELLRAPLLGKSVPLASWAIVALLGGLGGVLVFGLYARYRVKITYWL